MIASTAARRAKKAVETPTTVHSGPGLAIFGREELLPVHTVLKLSALYPGMRRFSEVARMGVFLS